MYFLEFLCYDIPTKGGENMSKNPYQPDLRPFLEYVNQELDYVSAFDLGSDPRLLKVGGALVILQEYLEEMCNEE